MVINVDTKIPPVFGWRGVFWGNAFLKTLSGKKLGSEIDEKLQERIENPIVFNVGNPDPAHGYEAEILVEICKAVLRAPKNN